MQSTESPTVSLTRLKAALQRAGQPLGLSDDRFDQSHELFERSSNQQNLILEWLISAISKHYADHNPLKILSVGCGSGILDNPLLQSIAPIAGRVEYTGVDPNAVACRRFRRDFEKLELSNVELDLREQGVESLASTEHFDFIHLVHSVYYFDDPAATLDALLNLLAPDGQAVIVQAPEAELNQLSKCFWTHHVENGIWFSDCLANHLAHRQIPYSRERLHGAVDVTPCFEADDHRGEMILDFITQSECRNFSNHILELCLSYLRSISHSDRDNLFVGHPADVFVIPGVERGAASSA